jgi:hypothetical protein
VCPKNKVTAAGTEQIHRNEQDRDGDVLLGLNAWQKSTDQQAARHVFLSYCEESSADCEVAAAVKDAIEDQGVSVFDRGQDVLPGQEEAHLVTFALSCKAFVVITSPAYRSDTLACRLDLHQVHQALSSGRVAPENVLFIHTTSSLLPSRHGNSHSCGNMAEAASTFGITHSSGRRQEQPNIQLPEQRAEDAARCEDAATACPALLTELDTGNE